MRRATLLECGVKIAFFPEARYTGYETASPLMAFPIVARSGDVGGLHKLEEPGGEALRSPRAGTALGRALRAHI